MGVSPYNVITFYYKAIVEVYFQVAEDCTGMGKVSVDKLIVPRGSSVSISGNTATIVNEGSSVATPISKQGYTTKFIIWNNDKTDETKTYTVKTVQGGEIFYAHFEQKINTFPVHFRVASDSTGLGQVSTAKGELTDYIEVPYGTTVTINNGKVVLSYENDSSSPKANSKTGYTVTFTQWNGADDRTTATVKTITKETWFWAHFDQQINTFPVHFRVASDSTGLGQVSTAKGELTDYLAVPYGTTVSIDANGKVVLSDGSNSTPKANSKEGYSVYFTQWNGADDLKTPTVTTITKETWFWAHFDTRGMPVQVEVKYLSNGAPIQIDGKNLDWVTASYYGNDVSINYKQNFSDDIASKLDGAYKLTKGYISLPSGKGNNQGATVVYNNVDTQRIVIQFEFDKKATYIQRSMVYPDGSSMPFPVAEMPEAYGLDAVVTVTATDPADIGKTAMVRIGDASGTFYGAGQSGTYNGYTYKVVSGDSGRADDVKVLIDGGINVCSEKSPLKFYYEFVAAN